LAAEEAVEVAPVGTCSPQKGNNIAAYMICWSYFWLCAQELPVFTVSEGAKVFAAWDLTGLKGHYSNADSSPPPSSSKMGWPEEGMVEGISKIQAGPWIWMQQLAGKGFCCLSSYHEVDSIQSTKCSIVLPSTAK